MPQNGIVKLQVNIKTKPYTRLLKYIPVLFLYVHGNHFKISISIKNLGSARFNGGELRVLIFFAFGNLKEQLPVTVPSIDINEEIELDLRGHDTWGGFGSWTFIVLS